MKTTKHIIKDGKEILIRLATESDAAALLEMKLGYLSNTKTIPLYKSEYPNNLASETQLIKRLGQEKNSVLFLAESNKKLIGNIDLNGNQRSKLFHTGVIGMGIREDWRAKGVGSALLEAVVHWSLYNPFLTLLWLEVYGTNAAGRMLYEKFGFQECGRIHNFFCEDNIFIDKITMVKHLK
jgi:RimJ/RimL family protein N-acetyltransferase